MDRKELSVSQAFWRILAALAILVVGAAITTEMSFAFHFVLGLVIMVLAFLFFGYFLILADRH